MRWEALHEGFRLFAAYQREVPILIDRTRKNIQAPKSGFKYKTSDRARVETSLQCATTISLGRYTLWQYIF